VTEGQGEDAAALGLARAYYPEFFAREGGAPLTPEATLTMEWPATEGEAMTLSTRGHVFQVKASGTGTRAPKRSLEGAVFYGPRHFWSMTGQGSQRVEEYVVLPEGTRDYRARYEVAVPDGIVAVRDAGDYLEFLDAREVPVLRMHYGVARDAEGLTRQAETRLRGVVATHREPARYALVERTLSVELVLGLKGLTGPIVVDPGWSSTGTMALNRFNFAVTLLPGGKVLVTGGATEYYSSTYTATAELYDPATGTWSSAGSMKLARSAHAMTLLPNGRVLVTGGYTSGVTTTPSAELYDPASGVWSYTASMGSGRTHHTATVLPNGSVLVAGGVNVNTLSDAELYDPSRMSWTRTGVMPERMSKHMAVLLPNGKVLVAGGSAASPTAKALLYDPFSSNWSYTGSMATARESLTGTLLPNGKVLAVGGNEWAGMIGSRAAELYDPVTGTWSTTGKTIHARPNSVAALLPNGKVLLVGGSDAEGLASRGGELYDPALGTWSLTPNMSTPHAYPGGTLLPDGRLLVMGGVGSNPVSLNAELFEPSLATRLPAGTLKTARASPTATLLHNGKVLVLGGQTSTGTIAPSELFDPATSSASIIDGPAVPRTEATVTLLPNGRVLVAGGQSSGVPSAQVDQYEPETNTWSTTGALGVPRSRQTATLLRDGRLLIAGGVDGSGAPLASAELYDPATGTWSPTGAMALAREGHVALSLPDGKVLVAAGKGSGAEALASAELYDPATGTWSPTGSLATARVGPSGVQLARGQVLVVAGRTTAGTFLASAERYDPGTGSWSAAGSLTTARDSATATLLLSEQVLVAGGRKDTTGTGLASLELYEPRTNSWTVASVSLAAGRRSHVAVPLPSGRVLFLGGGGTTPLTSNEVYDGVGASDAWRPSIAQPRTVFQNTAFVASGNRFRGISEAGGGRANTPATDFPAWVSLMPVGGGAITRLTPTQFSSISLSATVPSLAPGHYLLSVTVNGISGGRVVRLEPASVTAPDVSVVANEDSSVAVTLAASSNLGLPVGFSVLSAPSHGTLSGYAPNLTYTPAMNYFGGDSFRFRASDGTSWAEATVSLTVRPTPDAPVAQEVSITTVAGTPVALTLSGSDVDNDALSYRVNGPGVGTLSGTAPNLTYTPPSGFAGTVMFTYKVSDGSLESNAALVTVKVALPSHVATAVHDSGLQAPVCASAAAGCDSGSLLNGRGGVGPELNQPNTLGGSCSDGMAGAYHVQPSLDRLKVSSLNGGLLTGGRYAQIEATVWTASPYAERLDLFYTASASDPGWVHLGTFSPAAGGVQVIRVNYLLPSEVGTQAIRAIYSSGGTVFGVCAFNSEVTDHDDLVFTVGAPDALPPTVTLTSPTEGAILRSPLLLSATASDNVGVARVEFYDESLLLAIRTEPPYTWTIRGTWEGNHTLRARAYDMSGNASSFFTVNVIVDNVSPTVSLTAPAEGATVSGSVALTASATDTVGVTRVEFFVDDTPLGSTAAAPYAWTWDTASVTPGTHVLSARAHDAAGNVGTSAAVTVTVGDLSPPEVNAQR
jgi:N-acetylneuraminic acid mutarotase